MPMFVLGEYLSGENATPRRPAAIVQLRRGKPTLVSLLHPALPGLVWVRPHRSQRRQGCTT